jgi:uncharacterized protein (DUF1810 family)
MVRPKQGRIAQRPEFAGQWRYRLDAFNLDRFLVAQQACYARVVSELRAGEKRTHWMWFIFPQLDGLGNSLTAKHFAIQSIDEASAYLEDPTLGARLTECTTIVNSLEDLSARAIFGYPDNLKFHSSMTLFARAATGDSVFARALKKYFDSNLDAGTLERLWCRKTSPPCTSG